MKNSTASLLATLALVWPLMAISAEAAIVPDRPSLSTGPEALDAGILQLEVGSRFAGGTAPAAGFEAVQRFGLIPGLEFRVGAPLSVSGTTATSGMSLGAKAQFLEGYLLSLGALGNVDMSPQGPSSTQAALLGTLGLPANLSLTFNAGPSWSASGVEWTGALLLGYDPGDLWQVFGEIARYQDSAGSAVGWGADAGLSVRVTEDVIWDLAILKGLSPEVPDWAVTSGFALRWGSR
ncbi:hypothetical protein D3C86_456120 [compost metagenome]